jgi:hypothetical protein
MRMHAAALSRLRCVKWSLITGPPVTCTMQAQPFPLHCRRAPRCDALDGENISAAACGGALPCTAGATLFERF